jgi:tRNA threonylcarbamoyladenosine biosynthesis protein TsaB
MSLILSIDTSTYICSVALHQDGIVRAEADLYLEKSHSGSLSQLIEQLLSHCDFQMNDLVAVAVSSGPGSYTGLRIGMSTAKGLCFALGIPLIGVSSLDVMALQVSKFFLENKKQLLVPMIDARRMEVFYKCLKPDLTEIEELGNLILEENTFDKLLTENEELILFGNGAEKAIGLFENKRNLKIIEGVTPKAKFMGDLAFMKFEKQEFESLAYFEPNYGKEFFSPKSNKKPFVNLRS